MSRENLNITVVSDKEDFLKLREPWNRLAEANGNYTPWFCWEWFDLCLRHGEPGNLFVLTVRRGGELVAIAPLMVRKERYKGIFSARVISFIGGSRSFLKGIVFGSAPTWLQKEATALILGYLRSSFLTWDVFEIDPIDTEGYEDGYFDNLLGSMGYSFRNYVSCLNRYSDTIGDCYHTFFDELPHNTRKDIQYCRRRLDKNGALFFEIISHRNDIDKYLDIYDHIRSRSWKAPERDKLFNRELIQLVADKSWLRLGLLFYNNIPIAGQKWFISNRKAYIYDVLYDENYKKYSPGKLLTAYMFQYAIDNDFIVYADYLRGDEPYKEEWTPKIRQRHGFTVFNKTIRGKLLLLLIRHIAPRIKIIYNYWHSL